MKSFASMILSEERRIWYSTTAASLPGFDQLTWMSTCPPAIADAGPLMDPAARSGPTSSGLLVAETLLDSEISEIRLVLSASTRTKYLPIGTLLARAVPVTVLVGLPAGAAPGTDTGTPLTDESKTSVSPASLL